MTVQEWIGREEKRWCTLLHPRQGLRYIVDFIEQRDDGTYHYDASVWAYYLDETGRRTPSHLHWISDSIELFKDGRGRCVNCGNFHKPYAEKTGFIMCEPCIFDMAAKWTGKFIPPDTQINENAKIMGWEIL